MLEALLETISQAYDGVRNRKLLTALWQEERWFDTPRQLAAAKIARDAMIAGGLSRVEIVPYAADGKTRFQDWTTHMAWDCPAATLSIGDDVLTDRRSCPQSVVYWSGPLAETTASVVDVDALDSITPEQVAGKFVLTNQAPNVMKKKLIGMKPLAIVSDYIDDRRGFNEDTTKWCNDWSEGSAGWYFHACDELMTGFCLSTRQGKLLRERLADKPDLQLTASCDSRLYEGQGQCVTGVLEGTDPSKEIWLFGHACEQGAHDNCSGISCIIEALITLKTLIDRGELERPRCSLRIITTEECLGMLAFAEARPNLLARAMAGVNADAVGDCCEEDRPYSVFYGALSLPTISWPIAVSLGNILHRQNPQDYFIRSEYEAPSADHMIADPNCGVPSFWLGNGTNCTGYHSSSDTPEVCTDLSLRCNTLLLAAWAHTMGNLNDESVAALIEPVTQWIEDVIIPAEGDQAKRLRRWAAGRILRDPGRFGVSASVYEPAAEKYCPADAPPLDDLPASGARYVRKTWGTCRFETLKERPDIKLSCWSSKQAGTLFWNHGDYTIEAVTRLISAEMDSEVTQEYVQKLLEACVSADLAERA